MEKYYRLYFKITDNCAYVTYLNLSDTDSLNLFDGKKLEISSLKADVEHTWKPFPDIMGVSAAEILASNKFKEALLQILPETQLHFVPVDVDGKNYWLINTLNIINCFDREQSEYTTYQSGALRKVTKGVLKTELLQGIDLFRVAERPTVLFLSEKLKKHLEEKNIQGLYIVENANWQQDWNE